jgi:hypothetical protein
MARRPRGGQETRLSAAGRCTRAAEEKALNKGKVSKPTKFFATRDMKRSGKKSTKKLKKWEKK